MTKDEWFRVLLRAAEKLSEKGYPIDATLVALVEALNDEIMAQKK